MHLQTRFIKNDAKLCGTFCRNQEKKKIPQYLPNFQLPIVKKLETRDFKWLIVSDDKFHAPYIISNTFHNEIKKFIKFLSENINQDLS